MKTLKYLNKQYTVEDKYNWIAADINQDLDDNYYYHTVYVFTHKPERWTMKSNVIYNFRTFGDTKCLDVYKLQSADSSNNIAEISKLITKQSPTIEELSIKNIILQLNPIRGRIYANEKSFLNFLNLPCNTVSRILFDTEMCVIWRNKNTNNVQTSYFPIEILEEFFQHLDTIENEKIQS